MGDKANKHANWKWVFGMNNKYEEKTIMNPNFKRIDNLSL